MSTARSPEGALHRSSIAAVAGANAVVAPATIAASGAVAASLQAALGELPPNVVNGVTRVRQVG